MHFSRSCRKYALSLFAVLPLLCPLLCAAGESGTKIFQDFETPQELNHWEFKNHSATLSDQHVTHGQKSLRISANEYLLCFSPPKDWSAYDSLDMDVFVEGSNPVGVSLLIADEAWKKAPTYWNRHNGSFNLKPGANTVSIPVNGLYRGEAGSRGNDLKTNIDPKSIIRIDMGFTSKENQAGFLYIDHIRLVKESRPEGILAFDFGPESQAIAPGFAPITWTTVFGKDGAKAGLRHAQWSPNAARDDTFPTRLYQDYVVLQDIEFIAEVPVKDGKYGVWVMFADLGYWGGEQAQFRKRWIESEGKQLWSEEHSEFGPADYLFKFEKTEPKPGESIWDLYMADLFKAKRFEASASDGKLSLNFHADGVSACKVAAIIIYPESIKADAEKWIAEVEARNRKEFESRAVSMGPKPNGEAPQKLTLGFPSLEQDVSFYDPPGKPEGKLACVAARGQRISTTFAIQAPKDASGAITLSATDLAGAAGADKISASQIDLRYVQHALHRGFNDIAYTIGPESLRKIAGADLKLIGGLTRQFWITVHVPPDAKPGSYTGELTLNAGTVEQKLPLSIEVLDLALDEPDFSMAFYGTALPSGLPEARRKNAMRELCTIQKENGMNCISGGPPVMFSGFGADGAPQLDFAECDEFMKTVRECGFTRPFVAYGGPGMVQGLHDSYVIGELGHSWEKKTGKPFGEILKIVWGAVKTHAEQANWLPIDYEFADEPRVAETALRMLELMKLYREAVPYVRIGGSYSVNWSETKDPFNAAVRDIFKTLVWSALNDHSEADFSHAKELGRELTIYNQGKDRYSFGAFQWAEMHKGVRGRAEWHLLALHGHQFFDLDGREPDTAMINWGRDEIIPTLHLARCREGADDFRFAVTLWNLAQSKKAAPAAQAAIAWLEEVNTQIPIAQRSRPKGFMDDETFRSTCIDYIKKLQGK